MDNRNHDIPNGIDHVRLLDLGALHALKVGEQALKQNEKGNLKFIGVCMTVLYQAAPPEMSRRGTLARVAVRPRLQPLCSSNSSRKTKIGYYDEALNLVRGIGEIANLVALSAVEPDAIKQWLAADDKARRNKFSPARVRERLAKTAVMPMIADADWYGTLCEKYTHVTPNAKPNFHNDERPRCGGFFQEKGLDEVLGNLATILGFLAMFVCRFFDFDDLFKEISSMLKDDAAPS